MKERIEMEERKKGEEETNAYATRRPPRAEFSNGNDNLSAFFD
jgi:hypothetical protein